MSIWHMFRFFWFMLLPIMAMALSGCEQFPCHIANGQC